MHEIRCELLLLYERHIFVTAYADIYPYLVYKTQHDDKVRVSHQLLHDVCKPIIDTFWDTYYPPNGWRCRCYVLQARTDQGYKKEPDAYPDDKSIPPVFRHNLGKSGKVWNHKHPYFAVTDKDIKDKILKTRNLLLHDKNMYDDIEGVKVHYTNYANNSFMNEFEVAKALHNLENMKNIHMLSQIDDPNVKIPDYCCDNILIEYKDFSNSNYTTIYKKLKHSKHSAIAQLINNRYIATERIIIVKPSRFVSNQEVRTLIHNSKRALSYNIKLWIYENGKFIKE